MSRPHGMWIQGCLGGDVWARVVPENISPRVFEPTTHQSAASFISAAKQTWGFFLFIFFFFMSKLTKVQEVFIHTKAPPPVLWNVCTSLILQKIAQPKPARTFICLFFFFFWLIIMVKPIRQQHGQMAYTRCSWLLRIQNDSRFQHH